MKACQIRWKMLQYFMIKLRKIFDVSNGELIAYYFDKNKTIKMFETFEKQL